MPEVSRDLLTCVVCDKGGDTIKKCAKCFSVSYCGRECQVKDWIRHKRLCDPVMVKEFGEKGRGLVASKNFKVGDLIFNDTSVASIYITDEFLTIDNVIKYGKEVYDQISTLSDADQKNFFKLSGSAKLDVPLSYPAFEIIPEKFKRAFSIFKNNSIGSASDDKEEDLYLKYSMLNHSCDPNTIGVFEGKRLELRAIKEIDVGEEVTLSYIDAYTAILEERKEKKLKLEYWGFQCKCDICLQPETGRIKKLRNEWIEGMLKEKTMVDAMRRSKEKSEFLQTFANTLDQRVDFIIKVDKHFFSCYSSSLKLYCKLASIGFQADRPDLHKKGMSLLKKYLFGDADQFLLQYVYENDEKEMMMN